MPELVLCEVFRSRRREGMYLYVRRSTEADKGLKQVPEQLMTMFGAAESVMVLDLTPTRKLARANAVDVLRAIAEQGYYLQTPPSKFAEEGATPC